MPEPTENHPTSVYRLVSRTVECGLTLPFVMMALVAGGTLNCGEMGGGGGDNNIPLNCQPNGIHGTCMYAVGGVQLVLHQQTQTHLFGCKFQHCCEWCCFWHTQSMGGGAYSGTCTYPAHFLDATRHSCINYKIMTHQLYQLCTWLCTDIGSHFIR